MPANNIHIKDKYKLSQKTYRYINPKNINETFSSRGFLPTLNLDDTFQFVTFRLCDAIPVSIIKLVLELTNKFPEDEKIREKFKQYEKYLNKGYGKCILKKYKVACIVKDSLYYFDNKRYDLTAWVIMPNHVHILIKVYKGESISKIMQSLKAHSARNINRTLGTTGEIWMREYYDRYIRSGEHLDYCMNYIHDNPIKAGLCKRVEDWEFSSAYVAKKA